MNEASLHIWTNFYEPLKDWSKQENSLLERWCNSPFGTGISKTCSSTILCCLINLSEHESFWIFNLVARGIVFWAFELMENAAVHSATWVDGPTDSQRYKLQLFHIFLGHFTNSLSSVGLLGVGFLSPPCSSAFTQSSSRVSLQLPSH